MSDIAFDIAIPDSLISKIKSADKSLKTLAQTSEETKNRIVRAFSQMGYSVDDFAKKVQKAAEEMAKLGKTNITVNVKNIGTEAKRSVTDINKLIEAISKLSENQKKQIVNAANQQMYRQTINDIRELQVLEQERESRLREQIRQSRADERIRAEEIKTQALQNIANEKQRQIELKRSVEEINRLARTYKQLPTAFNSKQAGKIIADNENAKSINQKITAIKNLENAKRDLDTTDKKYEKTLAKLNSEINRYKRELETLTTLKPQALIDQKGQHKTLNELKTYANELKRTMNTLDPKSNEWKKLNKIYRKTNTQIQSINNKMKGFQNAAARSRGIVDQLRRSMMLLFSLSQIKGYVDKLIAVRGEFELQQRSLEAILQNKEKADEIWAKTIELAVKSPYQIKELVTYTKQLAAYRVESEKLFETTKMLADVSAGLGVDMQRIILAYGQVKAANYLRGTELRQFSEAGINILGELATYFSEIEDRAVSVGEVFQRVSQRMVSFGDVEQIFKRITAEGGTFYNMQMIQAETLKGMISNLKDSIDVAINEVGEENDNMLKSSIRMVKRLIDNFDSLKNVIVSVGAGAALVGLVKVIKAISLSVMTLINNLRGLAGAAGVFSGWLTVAGILLSVVTSIVFAVRNMNKEAKELSKIELTGASQASMMAGEYKKLADTISDATKTYEEQQKALNTLKRKYDEILPSHLLEAEAIRNLNGDYSKATQAINEYIAAKTKEKQLQYIEEEYGQKVVQSSEDLVTEMYKMLHEEFPALNRTDLNVLVGELQKEIEQGLVKSGKERERLVEMLGELLGFNQNQDVWSNLFEAYIKVNKLYTGTSERSITNFVNSIKQKRDEIEKVVNKKTWADIIYGDMVTIKKDFEERKSELQNFYDTIKQYHREAELPEAKRTVTEKQYNNALSQLNAIFTEAGKESPKWNEIINDPIRFNKATIDTNVALWDNMMEKIKKDTNDASKETRDNFLEILKAEQIEFAGNKLQQEVVRVLTFLSSEMNIPLNAHIGQLLASATESKDEYAKRLDEFIKSQKASIKQYEIDVKKNAGFSIYDPEQIDAMKQTLPLLEKYRTYFYYDDDKDSNKKIFEERLRVLKEMYNAYKDLNKTFDETESKEGVLEKYTQAFKDAYGFDPEEWGDFFISDEAYNLALDKLKKFAKDAKDRVKVELESGRVTWDLKIKLQKEKDQEITDQISKMFSDYESLLELDKLGISGAFAKKYFNIDSIDLAEIRKKIEDELSKAEAEGGREDFVKERKKELEKVTEMEVKAQQERLETYLKYTRDAISERAKIEFDAMRKIEEAKKTFDANDPLLDDAIDGIKREMNAALQALDWKEFSSSDTFVSVFNDLENASTQALTIMIDQLEAYKEEWADLPIDQMEAVAKQLEKMKKAREINEAVANPFASGAFAGGRLKAKDISQAQQDLLNADASILGSEQQISNMEYLLEMLYEEKNIFDQTIVSQETLKKLGIDDKKTQEEKEKILQNVIEAEQNNIHQQNQYKKSSQKTLDLAEKQKAVLEAQSKYLGEGLQLANDLYDAFKGLYEALGGDGDNPAAIFADMGMNMANTVIQTIQLQIQLNIAAQSATGFGVAMNAAMGVIGWIVMAVQLLTQAITAITKVHDNQLQKQIERDAEAVELLQKRYEALEETIENALSFHQYKKEFDEMQRSLKNQIALTEQMIQAEEAKKKTDTEQVKSWNEEIEEANKLLQENEENRIQALGGFGSQEAMKDAADSFIDAWMEAYRETGDGLDALRGQWDEYFENIVKKQIMMKTASKYIEPLLKMVDDKISDYNLTTDELKELEQMANDTSSELNKVLKSLASAIGFEGGSSGSSLEGLSESIQGVTEATAQALEAILNSIRFYVIDNNKQLIDMANRLESWESPTSPLLAELKAQTRHLESIADILNLVVDRSQNKIRVI